MIEFKGSHFEKEVILWGVRWYVAYPMSYRQLEEMMEERGVEVDHSTLNRWVIKYAPLLEQQFRAHKLPVGNYPPPFLGRRYLGRQAKVSRMVWKGFAPLSLAVSTVVLTSASAFAAHMAR